MREHRRPFDLDRREDNLLAKDKQDGRQLRCSDEYVGSGFSRTNLVRLKADTTYL